MSGGLFLGVVVVIVCSGVLSFDATCDADDSSDGWWGFEVK